jgi:hypothetical protein
MALRFVHTEEVTGSIPVPPTGRRHVCQVNGLDSHFRPLPLTMTISGTYVRISLEARERVNCQPFCQPAMSRTLLSDSRGDMPG